MPSPVVPQLDESAQRLTDLGFTLSEARCYVALLHVAPATAGEVAEAAGVARPKVYSILRTLEQRGFCFPSGDRVMTYRPVDPALALEEWMRVRRHERRLTDERDTRVHAELVAMLPVAPDPGADNGGQVFMDLTDAEHAIAMVEDMIRTAQRRVDIVVSAPVLQRPERWNRFEVEALRRGVQVRMLFVTRELADMHRYWEIVEAGGEVRVVGDAPIKTITRDDGAEAAVALRHPKDPGEHMYVAFRHPDLVAPIQLVFNRHWRRGVPLSAPAKAPAGG